MARTSKPHRRLSEAEFWRLVDEASEDMMWRKQRKDPKEERRRRRMDPLLHEQLFRVAPELVSLVGFPCPDIQCSMRGGELRERETGGFECGRCHTHFRSLVEWREKMDVLGAAIRYMRRFEAQLMA